MHLLRDVRKRMAASACWALAAACGLLCVSTALAQTGTSSLRGVVTDPSGAAVSAVRILSRSGDADTLHTWRFGEVDSVGTQEFTQFLDCLHVNTGAEAVFRVRLSC